MKKLLALVLALIMVMALAVSAFAVTVLGKDDDDEEDELTVLNLYNEAEKTIEVLNVEDEDYAILVDKKVGDVKMKNITATGTGIVKDVKVADFDPEVYDSEAAGVTYKVEEKAGVTTTYDGGKVAEGLTYDKAVEIRKALSKADKTTKYKVVAEQEVAVVEFTVAANTGVAYADGKLTIKATDKDGKNYSVKYTFVNDVIIFPYETVKAAAEYEDALVVGDNGYSDYRVAENGGKYTTAEQDDDSITCPDKASVVPTTAFRAIAGQELKVENSNRDVLVTVTIPEVAAAQKGVNFAGYTDAEYNDADDDDEKDADEAYTALKYGFYGKQVIASDYTIEIETGYNYFEFRELFGKKLEEEDIVTFYITKDGKAFDKFTVDYMTQDIYDTVDITINGKAGTTLGEYAISLTAPAGESEQNPNTGAESVVAVVAAVAAVAAVSAAAVSLKK